MNASLASLCGRLEQLLNNELSLYQRLIDLSREEQESLVTGEVNVLFRVIHDIEDITLEVKTSEESRSALIESFRQSLGASGQLVLSDVIRQVEEPYRGSFKGLQTRLFAAMKELHFLNDCNASLVRHSMEYTNYLLSLFTAAKKSPVYDASGSVEQTENLKLLDRHV